MPNKRTVTTKLCLARLHDRNHYIMNNFLSNNPEGIDLVDPCTGFLVDKYADG